MDSTDDLWKKEYQEDNRGWIKRYFLDNGTPEAKIFTKAGFFRGGEIHPCDQSHTIVSGYCTFTTLEDGIDVVREYRAGDSVLIPKGVAHLFEAIEDTIFTEFYHGDFLGTTYYPRYRDIVKNKMKERSLESKIN